MTTTNNVASTVNNNLQDALATLINKTVTGTDAATGHLQQQVLDVIHQLFVWKMVEAGATIASILLLFIVAFAVFRKWHKYAKARKEERPWAESALVTWEVSLYASSIVLGIPAVIVMVSSFTTVLQIWIAPKAWLIEYTANLLKGN